MLKKILLRNTKRFIEYNDKRKKVFAEIAPKESEYILYLLPWLLSINHPLCPGYVPEVKYPFRVFNVGNVREIKELEPTFKKNFGIKTKESLLPPPPKYYIIEGLYTIGSVGTVSQTPSSDCDIWLCYNKEDFDRKAWTHLNYKINLIKDWFDLNIKIPVYFFISDVNDIRRNFFGNVDSESSGSTQRNVLKEEFYRTTIVICGKIPLWWVCYSKNEELNYDEIAKKIEEDETFMNLDLIDFGNLESIDKDEYFGSAIWQIRKSFTRPLKSIIKMALLKMLVEESSQNLMSHRLRENVLDKKNHEEFIDPIIFTIKSIFDYYQLIGKNSIINFLNECFFLRCDIKPFDKKFSLKKRLMSELLKEYQIDIETQVKLSNFDEWDFNSQIKLGNRLFILLLRMYKEISVAYDGNKTQIDRQDLTILGRKIAAYYEKKNHKIPVIKKPTGKLNISELTLNIEENVWTIFPNNDKSSPLVASQDIIHVLAFIVWNNFFSQNQIKMIPNASRVTIQEITNLSIKLKEFFGTYDSLDIEYDYYLKNEFIIKLFVVISFESSPWDKDINDFGVIYLNNWGELFVRRFKAPGKLRDFLKELCGDKQGLNIKYYLQRNSSSYEKIIERTKQIILLSIGI
ncbi:MAG: class I adenylate cyclase [Desulfobacterales bacterium]|nr:class I adenylate cyclase [Desulfobacterales bacterium]